MKANKENIGKDGDRFISDFGGDMEMYTLEGNCLVNKSGYKTRVGYNIKEVIKNVEFLAPLTQAQYNKMLKWDDDGLVEEYGKALKLENTIKNKIAGYVVRKFKSYFVFGCGAIILHKSELQLIEKVLTSFPKGFAEIDEAIKQEIDESLLSNPSEYLSFTKQLLK